MKAPDKIVMPEATSQLRFTMTESVEYIRKDALLEWANKDLCPTAYLQLKNKWEDKRMSKRAEQRGFEAYPAPQLEGCSNILYDLEGNHREGFINGYEPALLPEEARLRGAAGEPAGVLDGGHQAQRQAGAQALPLRGIERDTN